MKNRIKLGALLVAAVLVLSLIGCAKKAEPGPMPSGTYKGKIGMEKVLEFSGDTVKDTYLFETKTGKVTVDGNKVIITYESGNNDWYIYDPVAETLDFGGVGEWILTKQR